MAKYNNTSKTKLPKKVIGALADAFGKSHTTIQRWVNKNDDRLTSDKAKRVFSEENINWN